MCDFTGIRGDQPGGDQDGEHEECDGEQHVVSPWAKFAPCRVGRVVASTTPAPVN
jgi:hypothetical protein